jgi:hypothetical protein
MICINTVDILVSGFLRLVIIVTKPPDVPSIFTQFKTDGPSRIPAINAPLPLGALFAWTIFLIPVLITI